MSCSLKERKTYVLSEKNCCDQETACLLNCENLNHKGEGSLGCSEVVKEFYKDSGKSQVGFLKIGRRHGKWPNQDKTSLHFSIPYLGYFYLTYFIFHT